MRENLGARWVDEVTVDVTSLDSAGTEPLSTFTADSDIDDPDNYFVVGQADPRFDVSIDRTNENLRVVERGPVIRQVSDDPASQEFGATGDTVINTYDAGPTGALVPLNFNPSDPTDADLSVVLRAEFHDGTTTDIATVADGTEQTRENLIDGFETGDDGLTVRKLIVVVNNGGTAVTEDIGAITTEFEAHNQEAPNNADIGEVTVRLEGRR